MFKVAARLVATLVIAVLATMPAAASASTSDFIDVSGAGVSTSYTGTISIPVVSTTPVTSFTLHLLDSGGTDVYDPPMTQTSSAPDGTFTQSTWAVTTPVTEAELPLGVYQMTVDATDAGGTSITGTRAGSFAFVAQPVVTLTADHTTISLDNPTATLTGNVQMKAPDGTLTPYQGSVTISPSWLAGGYEDVETDANGDYTATVTPLGSGPTVDASVKIPATGAWGWSPTVSFTTQSSAAKIAASLSAKTVAYGTTVTVTGTVSYQSAAAGGSYKPAAGQPVQVSSGTSDPNLVAQGTTNAAGKFSITLPHSISTTWDVSVGNAGANDLYPLLQPTWVYLPLTVNLPTAITKFHATLDQYWRVSVSGCLALARQIQYAQHPTTAGLTIQYSIGSPNGPWRTLTRSLTAGNGCGTQGVWFSRTATAPANLVYYRAHYPGATGYLATTSGKSLAWKYADRITNFSVSPTVVAKSGKVTVKGQLQYYANYKWNNYSGQVVEILFRQKGSSTWYWIVKVKTNSTGHFSAAVPVAGIGSATWSAEFNGNSTHLATAPPGVYVRVTG